MRPDDSELRGVRGVVQQEKKKGDDMTGDSRCPAFPRIDGLMWDQTMFQQTWVCG